MRMLQDFLQMAQAAMEAEAQKAKAEQAKLEAAYAAQLRALKEKVTAQLQATFGEAVAAELVQAGRWREEWNWVELYIETPIWAKFSAHKTEDKVVACYYFNHQHYNYGDLPMPVDVAAIFLLKAAEGVEAREKRQAEMEAGEKAEQEARAKDEAEREAWKAKRAEVQAQVWEPFVMWRLGYAAEAEHDRWIETAWVASDEPDENGYWLELGAGGTTRLKRFSVVAWVERVEVLHWDDDAAADVCARERVEDVLVRVPPKDAARLEAESDVMGVNDHHKPKLVTALMKQLLKNPIISQDGFPVWDTRIVRLWETIVGTYPFPEFDLSRREVGGLYKELGFVIGKSDWDAERAYEVKVQASDLERLPQLCEKYGMDYLPPNMGTEHE